ncbi:MAG: ferrochelatase [Leptospira sp.]|nr:ferrochelatase [Leptospira sp.]
MKTKKNKTLTLVNLGGPRSLSEIEVFLSDLFLDPYVFDLPLPEILRQSLARFIAKKRAPKVAKKYESMGFGGASPLVQETEKQAQALQSTLNTNSEINWTVEIAMACGFPNIREERFKKPSSNEIYLPLYPQFSRSTVLSTYNILYKKFGECPIGSGGIVPHFGNDPDYWKLYADFIIEYFSGNLDPKQFLHYDVYPKSKDWKGMNLVFSAHGIPMRLVKKGDTYIEEVNRNVNGIINHLRKKGFIGGFHISFQSKVGPAKWTEPNTIQVLQNLAKQKQDIAVIPISFVSDHLETLEEIGEEFREISMENGANSFYRIPAFGIYPKFIEYLAKIVLKADHNVTSCICSELGGNKLGKCRFENRSDT